VRAAISDAWTHHIEAAQRKDLDAVMKIYADDVVYIIPRIQEVRGRAEMEESEAETLAAADVLDAVHTIDDLRVYGELAYELGTVKGPVQPRGEPARTVTFHFMARWRRQSNGEWQIQHMVGEAEPSSPHGAASTP
jgi:ketosteroid isomerase-like protein